jgi:hypothetical protein
MSASGVTEPLLTLGAAPTLGAGAAAPTVPAPGPIGVVVPPSDELALDGAAEEELDVLESFFFMFIMKKSPTTKISTPITAIWTIGLLLSASLM